MEIYAVMEVTEQTFDNDACYEDGYYDDYYETTVSQADYLAFFTNKKEAEKCSNYLNQEDHETYVVAVEVDKVFNKEDFENE